MSKLKHTLRSFWHWLGTIGQRLISGDSKNPLSRNTAAAVMTVIIATALVVCATVTNAIVNPVYTTPTRVYLAPPTTTLTSTNTATRRPNIIITQTRTPTITKTRLVIPPTNTRSPSSTPEPISCTRRTCDSFSSCAAVRSYLRACPQYRSSLDQDNDGTPCESLCR